MTIGNTTSTQTAVQEARETPAQTQAEAARGDQQAARKLAAQNAAQPTPNVVDSARGVVNAQA
jgi:hypothetical protein